MMLPRGLFTIIAIIVLAGLLLVLIYIIWAVTIPAR
jgi:hypothetical protein